QAIVILAHDQSNPSSNSSWRKLSKDIQFHILHSIHFTSSSSNESIGKTPQQIYQFVDFILDHIQELNDLLKRGIGFKIIEKQSQSSLLLESTFHFRPYK